MQTKRLKIIACNVLFREISVCAAYSPHLIDVEFLHRSLHEEPDRLRSEVQKRIDENVGKDYDALLIGYGLCSNGTAGLVARDIPLVIPRGHDCITCLLGSRQEYDRIFSENPGTYFYTPGWIEREGLSTERISTQGEEAREKIYAEYVEKYGAENAKFLMDMLHSWQKNYSRALFIEMGLLDLEEVKAQARKVAGEYNWQYSEVQGDLGLMRAFVRGEWNPEAFLVVPSGGRTMQSFDPQEIITSEAGEVAREA
ncbi:MAG: DUF1638 domain-containing protein [Chloroflexota bacterium]